MVCGSAPVIASRRTVSRETPSRRANCAAVRKSAASSVSGGGGRRGAGMSAAARARASASSSSGGTGWSVSWWLFTVLGCMEGFLSQGPCPLGDLGGWSRGPICARICPGTLSRRWYANTLRQHRARRRRARAARPLAVPVIAADLQAPNFGSKREPGADLPRMQGPFTAARGRLGHAGSGPGYGGQLEGASVDAARKVST